MPSASRTIAINRPIAEVFAFVTDGANATKWRSGVLDTAHVSGTGVGEKWSQGVKGPGGRRIAGLTTRSRGARTARSPRTATAGGTGTGRRGTRAPMRQ